MNTADTAWPYDAVQDDPLTKLRIPVTTSHPEWVYLVAFNGKPLFDDDLMARPDETETRMLASMVEYTRQYWFNAGYQKRLLERPFDIDGGHNTLILRKWGENDWAYRRRTWEIGPQFVPVSPRLRDADSRLGPLTLAELLDLVHRYGEAEPIPAWQEWKAAHPDVFDA